MTEAPLSGQATAGAMLRHAREAQGLHLETLANIVKIPAKKLEALEADRFEELYDAAFARALAQTICRALKIDPQPVLARLPEGRLYSIEKVARGLNTPFRERELRADATAVNPFQRPFVWAAAILVVAAIALFVLPVRLQIPEFFPNTAGSDVPANAPAGGSGTVVTETIGAAEPTASSPQVVVDTVHSTPEVAPAASTPAAPVSGAVLVLHANAESWVEVLDRRGQSLFARTLAAGDSVGIDGALPMRLKVGNAAATVITFRGETIDLAPVTRDNVARLELK